MGGGSSKSRRSSSTKTAYSYRPGFPFDGILAFLSKQCQGNPHVKGFLEVTSSGTATRCTSKPEGILEGRDIGEWSSTNEDDSWIQIEFKEISVQLSAYTIGTSEGKVGTAHLKSWKLEGSNDGFEWVQLDSVPETNELNQPNAVLTRELSSANFFNFVRITQLTPNHFGTRCLTIKRIELFGQIAPRVDSTAN
jgi:hypothetical protein